MPKAIFSRFELGNAKWNTKSNAIKTSTHNAKGNALLAALLYCGSQKSRHMLRLVLCHTQAVTCYSALVMP